MRDVHDLTEAQALERARDRMTRTGSPLGVAVRRSWEDRRPDPQGDGRCAKVVITDGETDYAPETPVYVVRAMRSLEDFDEALENELELIAQGPQRTTQAKELALAVDEDRLTVALESFGLGHDRS